MEEVFQKMFRDSIIFTFYLKSKYNSELVK